MAGREGHEYARVRRDLTHHQHRRKEQILTQPAPSRVPKSTEAVVLKHGSVFMLTTRGGDIPWDLPHGMGLFFEDCRFLDGYILLINGQYPTTLSYMDARGFETYHDLANPELSAPDEKGTIPKETIAIRRERVIRNGVVHELIRLHNYGRGLAPLKVELHFRSSFEDIFILKGFVQDPRGDLLPPRVHRPNRVELRYMGRDHYLRTTSLVFDPPPDRLEADAAFFEVELGPGEEYRLAISIAPREQSPPHVAGGFAYPARDHEHIRRKLRRMESIWLDGAARIETSNPLFDNVLRRSLLDLHMLRSRLFGLRYFAAGVPWFVTLFGRDSALAAMQTLPFGPAMACQTLRLLARFQATTVDEYRDAQPGKILHELRTGELAQTNSIPQSPAYYGSVDSTLLFLILMAEYVNWSGDLDLARELRPNLDAALGWVDNYADHNGDGYIDYVGEYPNGLVNQGWKDSGNAIVNADGSLARPPIALCEVQSYLFRTWRQVAHLLRALGEHKRADGLERRASELRERFNRDFWSDELGCYVLALQKGGVPAEVVASNTGQVLWGGIAYPDRATKVAQRLMERDMFSGWGIRTLSSRERAYNPISYHLGSVWPHDNALIIAGLRRYGHDEEALRVYGALFDAVANMPDYRMPELYCGYERREGEQHPVRYPVACSPQAWAASSMPFALWNLLGLRADAVGGHLRIIRPCLPAWVDWLELRNLPVGQAHVDLRFERTGPGSYATVAVKVREGRLHVEQVRELVPPDVYT